MTTPAATEVVTGIRELATLDRGPVPRVGPAMSELGRIEDAALAVDGGRFVWVGPRRRLRRSVRLRSGGRTRDLGGAAVVPGFVDAHTHLLFGGDRADELALKVAGLDYAAIARRGGGLLSTVRATRRATGAALRAAALGRLRRMAALGTAAAEVKSGYALTIEGELALLREIPRLARATGMPLAATCLAAHAVPPEYAGRADAYVEAIIGRLLPVVAREGLARFVDVFVEPGYFSAAQGERLLRAAQALGLGTKLHADEFADSGGARLAARLGCRSADHLLATPPAGRRALARAGVTAVLLPLTPVAAMAPARSPGRAMVDAGVPVALGTDLSPNSWVESMPLVLAHAVYGARLTPAEAICAATVNAAHASGLADTVGRIAAGRRADFVAFDLPSVDRIPYRIGAIPAFVSRQGKPVSSR
ncbi:MAG TPA: imidazolonepropionase [Thermoplasmata archaeon]|nr:imidazolonepropionase [Thermoplasmata archaeon]